MATGLNFMETPLVVWVETFRNGRSLEFKDLYDGVFLNDVMQQIDPRPDKYENVNRAVEDISIRMHNWNILINNIRAYYLETLQQLLIMKLPNIQTICRDPDKDVSMNDMKKTLLLILGCAIQSEKKEHFIESIKQLEVGVQHAIVDHIKEITDDTEAVLPIEPSEQLETYAEKMFNHLTRLIKERDDFAEVSAELAHERDFYQTQAQCQAKGTPVPVTPPASPEKHHMVVELADSKAKIRRLRQEIEDKQEALSDLRDELEENKATITKLRNENVELIQDARAARSLRDELDVLREKLSKSDSYQNEILKYKEKLNELEFYKTRVEELREDNNILVETKNMLEEQLSNCHKRVETVIQLENEIIKKRQMVEELSMERDDDREKIRILTEENAQLQFEKKSSMNESTNLEQELESARLRIAGMGGTLSNQLTETTNAKILRLELENQRLQQKLEEMKENALIENATLNLELEKENQRLAKKVEKLQESSRESQQAYIELEQLSQKFEYEKEQLTQMLDTVKENSERHVKELERENEDLTQTVEVIRARNEKTNDVRMKDLERENKRITEAMSHKNQQFSKLEFENRQLQKSYNKLKHNCDRISELEKENSELEKQNLDLHKTITTLNLTCDKYEKLEQENSDMDVENRKLQKAMEGLQNQLHKKEVLEQDHINLTVENQKLQRTIESLKNSSSKIAEVETEKDALNREIQHLQKSLAAQRSMKSKQEEMELDLLDLDNENQKLSKSLEITTNRLQQLEKDNSDLELENEKLQKAVEKMKISNKRLQDVEKQMTDLEGEVTKLNKEKSVIEKENKRLKRSIELKDSAYDELSAKHSTLDRTHKNLQKSMDQNRDIGSKVRELEKENRELFQNSAVNKKTVATLREDLVNEKIKSQQLSNELEKLTQDLEKVGINKEKLVMVEHAQDDSRYKALENMMEEALKKTMEIKEEKIHALESRLEESKNRNLKLQEELRMLKRECESLKQRYEEESHGRERESVVPLRGSAPFTRGHGNPTREILELKDHLVQVERTNATMMAENKNLKTQTNDLNGQIKKLESQNVQLHKQTSSLQQQSSTLQSQNAKLQVENSTLQSQCHSLSGQNSTLQGHLNHLESEHQHLIQTHEELQTSHEQLVQDHEELQRLHEQLTTDYEALISEHGSLKSVHKSLKNENRELHDQLGKYLRGRDNMNLLQDKLEREKDIMQLELKSMQNLTAENNRLKEDHDRMSSQYEKLRTDYRDLLGDHKRMKTENNQLQSKNTELQGQCGDYKDHLHAMEMEINNLGNKYDTLYQVNQKMEEDNKNLLMQIQSLLNSNQDLLSQILNSKEHFAEEEKSYLEKMNDLRRQKERLEEKIMEHYKRQEVHKKNRGLGARIARKAAKIFVSRNQRSKSRTNLAETSADNTSQGSGSLGDTTDHGDSMRKSEKHNGRSSSTWNLTDESSLVKQNKSLAKSTTALNFSQDKNTDGVSFRGAKSTEDLLADSRSNLEKVSFSSSNSALLLPGLGRPANLYDEDDDGGFGATSPGDPTSRTKDKEMMTLEEFLFEANRSSPSGMKTNEKTQDDAESKSSENSDSAQKQRKRQAPPPPLHSVGQTNSNSRNSIPDVAVVSNLDLSRMSRISAGSSGSGHDSRPDEHSTPPHSIHGHPETSTPAYNNNRQSGSFDELNSFSPFLSGTHAFRRQTVGSTPPTASRTLQYSFGNSPQSSRQNNSIKSPQSRELPPTPSDGNNYTGSKENLPPAERLDRLMSGMPSSQNVASSASDNNMSVDNSINSSGNRDSYDRSYRPNQSYSEKPPPSKNSHSSHGPRVVVRPQQSWVKPQNSQQNPQQYSTPHYETERGPLNNVSGERYDLNSSRSSATNSVNSRRLSMHDGNSSQNIYSSIEETRSRQQQDSVQNNNSGNMVVNGPTRTNMNHVPPENHYARVQKIERPKSVPPNMFNQQQHSPQQSYQNNNEYSQPKKSTPPVPPPRRTREPVTTGRVSLLREPGQGNRQIIASRSQSTYQANTSNRQLPLGGRSQTPIVRIGPSPKPVNNTPPAPKPLNNEPKDPKGNSVWSSRC